MNWVDFIPQNRHGIAAGALFAVEHLPGDSQGASEHGVRLLEANAATLRLFELPEEELPDLAEICNRFTLPELERLLKRAAAAEALDSEGELSADAWLALPSGRQTRIRISLKFQPLSGGGTLWSGSLVNITDLARETAWLHEQLHLSKLCQEAARVGFWTLDVSTGLAQWSPGIQTIRGVSADDSIPLEEALAAYEEDSRRVLRDAIEHAAATGAGWDLVLTLSTEAGQSLRVRHVGRATEGGRTKQLYGILQDITAEAMHQEANQRLGRLELLGQLAGGIAHDFNNLLTSVTLSLDSIKADGTVGDPVRISLRDAENAAKGLRGLTRQLLTFAKGGEPVRAPTNLSRLLEETLDFTLSGSGCRIERDIAADLWPANVDRAQIQQVVQNLVLNARDATHDRGIIRVRACNRIISGFDVPGIAPGEYCEIAVEDDGHGIAEEMKDKIFSPYFTTKPLGTGLGLATSFSIAKRHDGYLTFDSRQGDGTSFTLLVPAERQQRPRETRRIGYLRRGKGEILLLDDQIDILRIAGAALERFGYEVTAVQNSEECLEAARRMQQNAGRYAAAVLDLTLPGSRDGIETLQLLREIDPQLPAIACTGYSNSEVMARPGDYGFHSALAKPFRIDELVEALQAATQGANGR